MIARRKAKVIDYDIELMQRITRRDQAAFSDLYHRYGKLVFSMAMRVVQNSTLAEEVTQDTFMKVWNRPDSWDSTKGMLSTWLVTVTRYTAIDRLRKESPYYGDDVLDNALHISTESDLTSDGDFQDGQLLRSLLTEIPPEQAQLIEMSFFLGMSHSELADKLKLPLGTVKTRLRSGLQKLKILWEKANR